MAIWRFLNSFVAPEAFPPLPRLDHPVVVIGDVHGCAALLDRLLLTLEAHPNAKNAHVLFVGDIIDRGPEVASVLRRIHAMTCDSGPFAQVTCLRGNHEQMLLRFLEEPSEYGPRWLAHGGDVTLASFGIDPHSVPRKDVKQVNARLEELRDRFRAALGQALEDWLHNRPLFWREDRLAVTHAGADPQVSIENQDRRALIWGDPAFHRRQRTDGIWVAHGHRIAANVSAVDGRISVDTGAYRTGRLSAAWLEDGRVEFLESTLD